MMNIRERCHQIVAFFRRAPQGTVREAAKAAGISKSAAQRHKQAIARRNQYPESSFWETEHGYRWLIRLVCATIYMFGIRGGMGVRALSEFFQLIRVDTHLAVSPSSLCQLVARIETVILAYKERYEVSHTSMVQAIVGADETFFEQILLVMVELSSGYILLEEAAEDRTFLTWQDRATRALQRVGAEVRYLVSDKAKALIKLALDGVGCPHIPDLFHACHEVVKCLGGRFATKLARVRQEVATASATLVRLREQGKDAATIAEQEQQVATLTQQQHHLEQGQAHYHDALHQISKSVHPFSCETLARHTSAEVNEQLHDTVKRLGDLSAEYALKDSQNRLGKVEKQGPEIAKLIDVWWVWVAESLAPYSLPSELESWVCDVVLSEMYWRGQVERASSGPLKQAYHQAHARAHERLLSHHFTTQLHAQEVERWQHWAHWMVSKFHRTSSAVEGRNGVLSRMNHAQRAIPLRRLKVLTVVHNFGLHREDGTTAAERFFGEPCPDLFEWIVEHIDDLPLPRQRLKTA
jgi:hypothetical protein